MKTVNSCYRCVGDLFLGSFFSLERSFRDYFWSSEQATELCTDLVSHFRACYLPTDEFHAVLDYDKFYLGALTFGRKESSGPLVTVYLFLLALYVHSRKRGSIYARHLARRLWSEEDGLFRNHLNWPELDLNWPEFESAVGFLAGRSATPPAQESRQASLLVSRFSDITSANLFGDEEFPLDEFISWTLNNVGFSETTLFEETRDGELFQKGNGLTTSPANTVPGS